MHRAGCCWFLGRARGGGRALLLPDLRRKHFTAPLFNWFQKTLPPMSQTEREAIDAGTVWWDGELFSGRPDWDKLLAYPKRN
jgi:acyl-CoA dehydrogenase